MRRGRIATVVSGVLLLVGTPIAWQSTRPPASTGSIATPVVDEPTPRTPTSPAPSVPVVEAAPGRDPLAAIRPVGRAIPATVRIPSLGVVSRVVQVGVDPDGGMQIPEDVATVGWYRFGPAPADPGATVIAGHVDSRVLGRGAFFDLILLEVGDRVEVELDDGTVRLYEVRGREVIDKDVIPLEDVFDRQGAPRLVLITCGGPFDRGSGHYESNVVVVAVPVAG